jgi:5-methylcytosine-specific restriction enzyme subunit McrC
LDASRGAPYGLGIGDFYRLFAYGHRFLDASGEALLVFPRFTQLDEPLPVFEYSDQLRLWAIPFDLESGAVPTILRTMMAGREPSVA